MKAMLRLRYAIIATMIAGTFAVAMPSSADAALRNVRGTEIRALLKDLREAVRSRDVEAIRLNVRELTLYIRNRVSPN
jgi:hypothetical protein